VRFIAGGDKSFELEFLLLPLTSSPSVPSDFSHALLPPDPTTPGIADVNPLQTALMLEPNFQ